MLCASVVHFIAEYSTVAASIYYLLLTHIIAQASNYLHNKLFCFCLMAVQSMYSHGPYLFLVNLNALVKDFLICESTSPVVCGGLLRGGFAQTCV